MSRGVLVKLIVGAGLLAGCSSDEPPAGACTTDEDCPSGFVCVEARTCIGQPGMDAGTATDPDAGATVRELVSIRIEPDTLTLVSANGDRPMGRFEVIGTYSDGTSGTVRGAQFVLEPVVLGRLDPASGDFEASGLVGGAGQVTGTVDASGQTLTAQASLQILVTRELLGPGVPADVADRFSGTPVTDPARAAGLVYPLDRAVMPQNVFPARIQWLTSAPGDLFRVRLEKPSAQITAYLATTTTSDNSWLADEAGWHQLAQTDPDAWASIEVQRLHAATGEVIAGAPIEVRFVPAAVSGSVYFWDIGRRRILRIDDGSGEAVSFMPNPPNPAPTAPGGPIPENCVGCHSISTSGRYMAGRLGPGNNIGGVFDLTLDLTQQPVPTTFPVVSEPASVKWWFSTWSPDDTRLAITVDEATPNARLALLDPFTGQFVTPQGNLPGGGGITHPSWSPDGTAIAYISGADSWGGVNATGDVTVLPVTGPDAVGTPQVIHAGQDLASGTPPGAADAYPTWTPDSEWLVFAHGSSSRSESGASALYMVRRDGSTVTRLDNASGGPATQDTFQPNMSPFHVGGYFWVSYLSKRDYGNATAGSRATGRAQVWVSAIRDTPVPGEDPSEVGYWLPGQDVLSTNISAFWAPRPCRPDGDACEVASVCCSGDCRPDETGAAVCSPTTPGRCREEGEACSADADCCGNLTCIGESCGNL